MCHRREQWIGNAEETVGAHLQQDARQDHADRRGRLNVGIGQPRVERESRHLDRKADPEEQKHHPAEAVAQQLRVGIVEQTLNRGVGAHGNDVERTVAANSLTTVEIAGHDGHQHQHGAGQREQEELDGGVFLARPAPHADEEVHRQQHHFPEHIEQEEIERQEHPQHAGLEQQEQNVIALLCLLDRVAAPASQETDQAGENDEREAQAVHAEVVLDLELVARDPLRTLDMPQRILRPIARAEDCLLYFIGSDSLREIVFEQRDRQQESQKGEDHGDRPSARLRSKQTQHRAKGRQEDDPGQDVIG